MAKTRLWLEDILEALGHIEEFVLGRGRDDYLQSELLRAAVERKLIIIGEATGRLAKHAPEIAQHISASRQIVGFRNLLAHEYDQISPELVWEIVQKDLPTLRQEVTALLERLGVEEG